MNLALCLREDTITQLIEILDSEFVAHVKGTPASGKTTMAMLLVERLEKEGRKVVSYALCHGISTEITTGQLLLMKLLNRIWISTLVNSTATPALCSS
jgi:predicted AAA+ superfamily ATPase